MQCSREAAAHILNHAATVLEKDDPDDLKLQRLWHILTIFRASMLAHLLRNTVGMEVMAGPFRGMKLTSAVMTHIYGPLLTGRYEHELHAVMEQVIGRPYQRILNIGCGFGYYSTGLALRMPGVTVHGFDTSEEEQKKCREMAVLNGVEDRIHIGGEFHGEDFASYADGKTLIFMDIEGAEKELIDPARYPALAKLDMIVEMHDVYGEPLSRVLPARFASTHDIEIIYNRANLFDFEPVLGREYYVDPLDSLIIAWENRAGPTPWAVMRAR